MSKGNAETIEEGENRRSFGRDERDWRCLGTDNTDESGILWQGNGRQLSVEFSWDRDVRCPHDEITEDTFKEDTVDSSTPRGDEGIFQCIEGKRSEDIGGRRDTRVVRASSPEGKVQAANDVETTLSRLLVIVENYPQLQSSQSFQTLMIQLEGTENRISVERQRFNDQIRDFNLLVKGFPSKILASIFGFKERTYFQAAPGSEQAPKVNF